MPHAAPSPASSSSSSVSFGDPDGSASLDSAAVAGASAANGDDLLATCLELIAEDGVEHQVDRAHEDLPSSESQPLEVQPPTPEHPPLLQQNHHCLPIPNPPIPQSFPSAVLPPTLDPANPAMIPVVFAPPPRVFVVQQPPIRSQVVACVPFPPRPVFLNNFPPSAVHIPQAAVLATAGTASHPPPVPAAAGTKKPRKRRGKNTVILNEGEECADDPREEVGRVEMSSPKKKRPPHCEICGREFSAERFLRLHVAEIHEEGGKGRFTCGDCGKVYTRLRSLERHQNRHHLDGDPVCKICRKRVVNFDLHYRRFHCKSKSTQACPKSKRRRRRKVHAEPEMTD